MIHGVDVQHIVLQDICIKAEYATESDKVIYLEGVIDDGGFDISLTNRPDQWDRCIEWLEEAV